MKSLWSLPQYHCTDSLHYAAIVALSTVISMTLKIVKSLQNVENVAVRPLHRFSIINPLMQAFWHFPFSAPLPGLREAWLFKA